MPSARIAEIALRVRDLPAMVAFYRDELGFAVHLELNDVTFLEVGPLEGPLGAGGHPQLLALFNRGHPIDPTRSAFDHIAFEIPPEDYDAERARFGDRDMVISERAYPESLPWPGRSFFIRDPEGNVVEFITGG